VSVGWKPFLLRPDMPENGKSKGPPPEGRTSHAPQGRLKEAGNAVGIDFTGKTDRYPNSVKAHTLLTFAEKSAGREKQNELQEVLFRHYFTDGRYPDEGNLQAAATEVGLDVDEAMAAVANTQLQGVAREEALEASQMGVTGVPYFIIDGKPFGSGAQPPEAFVTALTRAAAK